jgi:hypothetical protein
VGCRNALHNGGSRNYLLIRFDDGVVRQCGEFELRQTKLRSRKIADEQFYTDRIRPTDLADTDKAREAERLAAMRRTLFVPGSVLNRLIGSSSVLGIFI